MSKKESALITIPEGCVGIQSVGGFDASPEPLFAGEHFTNATVHSIPLTGRILPTIDGEQKFFVTYRLNPDKVPTLYKDPKWLPVSDRQIKSFVNETSHLVIHTKLKKSSKRPPFPKRGSEGLFEPFDALSSKRKLVFLKHASNALLKALQAQKPDVFESVAISAGEKS